MRKQLLTLFLTFMKIGVVTFGGGYAMIAIIENICVEEKKWITHDEMMNITVIAESTPGPIAINCATFVGYKIGGFSGAVAATVGVVVPSFVIIFAISSFLDNFLEITVIANAFKGIKIAVALLIVNAARNMYVKMKKTPLSLALAAGAGIIMLLVDLFSWNFSAVALMAMAGCISLGITALGRKGGGV